jgi:hypothetical protein
LSHRKHLRTVTIWWPQCEQKRPEVATSP